MTDHTGIHARDVHTRCRFGDIPPALVTPKWRDVNHERGEFPQVHHIAEQKIAQFIDGIVDDVDARRERVLAGLMLDWQTPPYTRWARPATTGGCDA